MRGRESEREKEREERAIGRRKQRKMTPRKDVIRTEGWRRSEGDRVQRGDEK